MTSTEESQTVTMIETNGVQRPNNIKRNLSLYRYSATAATKIQPIRRLLGKKCWKEVKAIIYDDSTLKIFDDSKLRDPVFEIKLETVALYLAFGKAAVKYGPPPIVEEECNYVSANNFFAVPESKDRDKIHWFAVKDELGMKELIRVIAETVDGKVNPPQLGKGPKYRYPQDHHESKWQTYWTACAEQAATADENGDEPKFVATPLVAVLEHKKSVEPKKASPPAPTKNGLAKSKPTPVPRQNYYDIKVDVPEKVENLGYQDNGGLSESIDTDDKTTVVRLINGKRVKEIVTNAKKESSPSPPDYPPPPVPTFVMHNDDDGALAEANVDLERDRQGTVTLVDDRPTMIVSTKTIKIEPREETVEIVASQHSAVVSMATVEHTVSTSTEYVQNGVTCTTTKETTSFQQTNANGTAAVH